MNKQAVTLSLLLGSTILIPGFAIAQDRSGHTYSHFWGIQVEELEYRYSDDDAELGVWNADAFYGSDELKFRWLTKGEYEIEEKAYESLENQLLLQKPISDFFDAKLGIRVDTPEGPDRTYGVLGVAGLAPYWFEVDASVYVSDEGDASAELDAEYELLLTNHLILNLGLDTTVAFSEDEAIGLGQGLASTELGARLSYDVIDRVFSPYVGVVHERKYGDTRDLSRAEGGSTEDWFVVVGTRLVF